MKKQWKFFLLAFVLPLLGIFWWVGAFTEVKVETGQMRGPYHFAYAEHSGDYANLPDSQLAVLRVLKDQGIEHGAALSLMQDDPRATSRKKLTALTGYVVADGVKVREPLKLMDIPARAVIVASVRAHPRLAPGKVYAALLKYLDERGMKLKVPTLEVYQNNEFSVEMEL